MLDLWLLNQFGSSWTLFYLELSESFESGINYLRECDRTAIVTASPNTNFCRQTYFTFNRDYHNKVRYQKMQNLINQYKENMRPSPADVYSLVHKINAIRVKRGA